MAYETSIDFLSDEKYITYFSNSASEIRYIKSLTQNPDVKVIFDETDQEEGGIEVQIPKKWYRRPRVPTTKNLTEEQKQFHAKILADARAKKKTEKESEE